LALKIIPIFRDVSPFEGLTDFQALKNFRFSATSASESGTKTFVPKMKVKGTGWQMLQRRYNKRGIALVIGAGVSSGCNLPDWAGLLRGMARLIFGNENTVFEDLSGAGWSLPSVASLLDMRRRNVEFRGLIRDALYEHFPFRSPAVTEEQKRKLVDYVNQHNDTMRAVASLCAIKEGVKIIPNQRIAALVNFNLDSVLRSYSRAKHREWLFRTIESAKILAPRDRIPIYHMHGLVPFYATNTEETSAPEELVMTEQQYFDFFNRPTTVFNYTFLYLLREYNCLFIGMSMRDDNIRRLLHYSTFERRGTKGTVKQGVPLKTALRHFAILRHPGRGHLDKLTETSLQGLGTRVLWVRDFSEIPARLGSLYEGAGDHWADVY